MYSIRVREISVLKKILLADEHSKPRNAAIAATDCENNNNSDSLQTRWNFRVVCGDSQYRVQPGEGTLQAYLRARTPVIKKYNLRVNIGVPFWEM